MNILISAALVVNSVAVATLFAEPAVYYASGDSDSSVLVSEIDPSGPGVLFTLDELPIGAGTGTTYYSPAIVESGVGDFDSPPPVHYEIEAAINASKDTAYNTEAGQVITESIGDWVYTMLSPLENVLPFSYQRVGDPFPGCWTCPTLQRSLVGDDVIRYLPFRWRRIGENVWSYGWVAFRVDEYFTPACFMSCGPDQYLVEQATFDFIAVGWETVPGIPIVAGGGLCRGDVNFDAQANFLDVSAFLTMFSSGDLSADLTGEGDLNFLDVSAFLTHFGSCAF